jgi:hypothetical protein
MYCYSKTPLNHPFKNFQRRSKALSRRFLIVLASYIIIQISFLFKKLIVLTFLIHSSLEFSCKFLQIFPLALYQNTAAFLNSYITLITFFIRCWYYKLLNLLLPSFLFKLQVAAGFPPCFVSTLHCIFEQNLLIRFHTNHPSIKMES